ncbi:hypothetical protein GCM10007895_30700 [Paraferrimonas sedimenticola]|uniref:Uncharacterized protein n=1 Tax=Paraferrimonas sedimenticola TaxID=375674 RepID=A0AA37RYX2_9GAMM|nr:hypothetical protein GCM10007895_30700 [Paraferrimonas sedimenticola]
MNDSVGFTTLQISGIVLIALGLKLGITNSYYLSGLSVGLIGLYFFLLSNSLLKRSNLIYLSLLAALAFSLVWDKGFSYAMLFTFTVCCLSFYYLHYKLIPESD